MFKRRTPDAILLTVPHTGTTFVRTLLSKACADSDPYAKAYVPDAHWLDEGIAENWDKIVQTKLIITARDPYLSAIRAIKNGQENPVEWIADAWTLCFDAMSKTKHVVFDIDCPVQARLNCAQNAIKFIGIDLALDRIDGYVERWIPQNESTSIYKTEYLEIGKLPNGYDWELLDDAVEWYKALTNNT